MPAYTTRRALAGALLLLTAACGAETTAPVADRAATPLPRTEGHELRIDVPEGAYETSTGDAVLLGVAGAAVDSVTGAAGVQATVLTADGATHLLLTGRFPRGAAARVATVWTRGGATPAFAVEQAVGAGSLRQQRTAGYTVALR